MTSLTHIDDTIKIGYYSGTFDPIHHGHTAVVNSALKSGKFEFILLTVDDEANPNKPSRLPWSYRLQMVKEVFNTNTKILVW